MIPINKYTHIFFNLLVLVLLFSCKQEVKEKPILAISPKAYTLKEKLEHLHTANDNSVLVIAHRGDWRNAPENSIQAIQNCIDMGVDIVEIDVRKTKDNQLVIIHDNTLDRTTTGKGLISDWTLDSLKTLRLKNGLGRPTHHKIPTLEEALLTAKGKILVNLDKCYGYFDEAFKIIQKTGTSQQVIIKSFNKTAEEVRSDLGIKLNSIVFMPVINLNKQKNASTVIEAFQQHLKPVAFEIVFSSDTSKVIKQFSQIKERGSRVWVNSLWESLNSGYDDDTAVNHTDSIYGWYIEKGVNMIQTDRPELLLNYLRRKGLHK